MKNKSIFSYLTLALIIFSTFTSCAQNRNTGNIFLVNFKSKDVGNVRFYLQFDIQGRNVKGGSLQNAYKNTFSFFDRKKISLFAGLKDDRLISVQGIIDSADSHKFHTAFFSPLGNYYFDGTFSGDTISGNVLTANGVISGKIDGYKITTPAPTKLMDYRKISDQLLAAFSKEFYNPSFILSKNYAKFSENIRKNSSNSIDDLHYVFSVFYYMRSLPYSHIGIWRNAGKAQEVNEDSLVTYRQKEGVGILKIKSFDLDSGIIANKFTKILKDPPTNLIIDLRNNPGGNIGPALELGKFIADQPVGEGYFLTRKYYSSNEKSTSDCHVFSKGNVSDFMSCLEKYKCVHVQLQPQATVFKGKIYVLVNRATASTCEPIAYALQKLNNVKIAGQNTAGKMLSAKEVELSDNFILFVPSADYITDTGERLDQKGVAPDILLSADKDQLDQLISQIK